MPYPEFLFEFKDENLFKGEGDFGSCRSGLLDKIEDLPLFISPHKRIGQTDCG